MPLNLNQLTRYVAEHIGEFHERRLDSLQAINLDAVLKRKNPYLFRAKNIGTAGDLVKVIVDAHLSSQEETLFGAVLEGLAIFACQSAFGGRKSNAVGIDLEFERDGIRYLVAIKSGPNWGNSGQIVKMKDNFRLAQRVLRTSGGRVNSRAINGCCYGRDNRPDKGDYDKLCGQRFWSFISGSETLYQDLIEPLGHQAREKNEAFATLLNAQINLLTQQFIDRYCAPDGHINWALIVALGSSENPPTRELKS